MGLETATYINDLVTTNPLGSDAKSKGDDHIRLIKSALKASLQGFTGPVILYGADTGVVNNYALTPSPAITAYYPGMLVLFSPSATNTTAPTLNISALGAENIKDVSGTALSSGDLAVGSYYLLIYDGTDFKVLNGPTKNYVDQLSFSGALPSQATFSGYYLKTDGTNASWFNILNSPTFTGTPAGPTAAVDTNTTQLATTAFVIGQGYAKLAGPTFTGNVTVPTLAADVTTPYAINAAWYNGQIGTATPLVDGTATAGTSKKWSPIDHRHPTDTTRAPLASPTFTGIPAGPTAAVNTNTTQLATTAFVVAQIADDVPAYIPAAASQSEMEAASSNTVMATPGTVKWHPGVAKAWLICNAAGSISASHNIAGIVDAGPGIVTITLTTAFSSTSFVVVASVDLAGGVGRPQITGTNAITIRSYDSGAAATDPSLYYMAAFGDQ